MTNDREPPADPAFEVLTHQPPLRERARDRLEQLIVNGVYKPGQHLVETDLAKRLGVSRGPVREALYMLELQGWVDLRPRQGAFVHAPSVDDIDHFFEVRILLESEVSRLVASDIGPDDLVYLRQRIAEARAALERGDEPQVVEANGRFHGYVNRLSRNPVLVDVLTTLDKRLRWYFAPVAMERAPDAWNEHEQLCQAFERRDAEAAAQITRDHSENTRSAYLRFRERTEREPAGSNVR